MFADKEKKGMMKFQQLLEQKHTTALKNLLQNKDFRFYMAELLGVCKTFENAFDEKGNVAAFNNGKQAIGQKIFNDIMLISPQAYITMCQEEQEILSLRNQLGDK